MNQNFTEKLHNGVKLEMIAIPGGSFLMGAEDFDDTRPVHAVTLSPFYIGKFPVTQAQWKAMMGTNPLYFKGDTLPVEKVSWDDTVSFCEKLSKETGKAYRLPTEAEWEYACRAGGDSQSIPSLDDGWFCENSDDKTHPVGEKLPNNWGLHDMHGNVWEWCSDWYKKDYYRVSPSTDPIGPKTGKSRVLRGGSWFYPHNCARSVYRCDDHAASRDLNAGFRVVLERSLEIQAKLHQVEWSMLSTMNSDLEEL